VLTGPSTSPYKGLMVKIYVLPYSSSLILKEVKPGPRVSVLVSNTKKKHKEKLTVAEKIICID